MDFKKITYWVSIVGPVFDILAGTFSAIKELVFKYSDNRRYISEYEQFKEDNK